MESIRNAPLIGENLGDRRRTLTHSWRLSFILVLLPVVIQIGAALFPTAVERFYSQGIYPRLARAIGFVTGIAPFSVAEVALIVLVVAIPVLTASYILHFFRNMESW